MHLGKENCEKKTKEEEMEGKIREEIEGGDERAGMLREWMEVDENRGRKFNG